mgnify:CR=1 FL=1
MRRDKHVKLIIHPDGSCAVDALNFTDATCTEATRQITEILSGRIVQEHLKPEARIPQRAGHARKEAAR